MIIMRGSANLLMMKRIGDMLAGRAEVLTPLQINDTGS
jgi:hypothetical protein